MSKNFLSVKKYFLFFLGELAKCEIKLGVPKWCEQTHIWKNKSQKALIYWWCWKTSGWRFSIRYALIAMDLDLNVTTLNYEQLKQAPPKPNTPTLTPSQRSKNKIQYRAISIHCIFCSVVQKAAITLPLPNAPPHPTPGPKAPSRPLWVSWLI